MTRAYQQRARAEKSSDTARRIVAAARTLMPNADEFQVDEIARLAGVSVPTVYSHFGSKGGLLSALVGQIESELGLFAGFGRVWECRDGESALRTMLASTLDFWRQAWTFIEFALRTRRTDPEVGARIDRLDRSRLGHLVVICRRLGEEGRLMPGLTPASAARLAFALTTPYVYESLVVHNKVRAVAARGLVIDAVVAAVVRTGTTPRPSHIDWARLGLKPPVT